MNYLSNAKDYKALQEWNLIIHFFTFEDYFNVFEKRKHIMSKMTLIVSEKHIVYTVNYNKKSLYVDSNKRVFSKDGNDL